ncbi:IPT/TIG domain-containing protein [Fusibacter sp. JL298sf-3]
MNLKRKLAWLMALMVIIVNIPLSGIVHALEVGTNNTQPITVDDIKYARTHNVFEISSGFLEIFGDNLKDVDVRFNTPDGYEAMGTRTVNEGSFVKFVLTAEETQRFTGTVRIGNKNVNLNTGTFPNITSSDKQTVNKDDAAYSITFTGNRLDRINQNIGGVTVEGYYGAGISQETLGTAGSASALTLNNPVNPGDLGNQNITLKKEETITHATGDYNISVEYSYVNAFRIIEDLPITNVEMFPNTGAKGDEVYFTGQGFTDTRNYQVYFLTALDGSDPYTNVNKAEFVSLGKDGTDDVLIVKVPNHPDFERRNYYVMITDVQNGQVVAEHLVQFGGSPDQYTVIQADFKPSIVSIYPNIGPDTGSDVEIKANYVLTLNIPDLSTNGNFKTGFPQGENSNETLYIEYDDTGATYKGQPVEIERRINMQIGKKVTFSEIGGEFQVVKGKPDQIIVTTQSINDAEIDPKKDVVIEMETKLTVTAGPNAGRTYVFNQILSEPKGYEFEPSTYTPEIDTITPDIVQVDDTSVPAGFQKLKDDLLISIEGKQFLVDRVVEPSGNVITRKPTVLIKKDDGNTFNDRYQLGFFPNEEYTAGGVTVRGIIRYKDTETDATSEVLLDADGKPVPLDMVILDDSGAVVDGTGGKELGTRLLIRIPRQAVIKDAGIKHVQVTNPVRQSQAYGKSAIKSDFLEFIKTTDIPVIETIKPTIITVEGGEEIVITGSNLQNGMKLYLDGKEITSFTRELDPAGNKTVVTFTAPPGREGVTQIAIVNPSGGTAVSDFTYVSTFNQDPEFHSFTPESGTAGTLVVVNGDNFLRPDPTAVTERGVDAFRLIGTRMLIDGREVNTYNTDAIGTILFPKYSVPDAQALIDKDVAKAIFSPFYKNATVTENGSGDVVTLTNDAQGNPAFQIGSETYSFRYNSSDSKYEAFDAQGSLIGDANITFTANGEKGTTQIAIAGGPSFTAEMDNSLVRIGRDQDGNQKVFLADYADSITLKAGLDERFVISTDLLGRVVLTNGKDQTYELIVDGSGTGIIAKDALGFTKPVATENGGTLVNGIDLDGKILEMITPYKWDVNTGEITGHRAKVISKEQIIFYVPTLTTGRGYKDLVIMNPDTKNAAKTGDDGFFYITQASSKPIITTIEPNEGSVDGGYFVTISGSGFEDDVRVFIDSVEVPKADTTVALDGSSIVIKMPASIKNLNEDFGVDAMSVPVVVLNPDGGNDAREKGFTYIIPKSEPFIENIIPTGGSSNGGEIVEILGYEFRYYEPYDDKVGGQGYDIGDPFEDLNKNGKWDDLLARPLEDLIAEGIIQRHDELTNPYHDYYYTSEVLPKVYIGENEARIVEFARGYIKVITPTHKAGAVDVYVINNDSGVSNKVKYTYSTTTPVIDRIVPDFGRRQGQEPKDLYGSKLYPSQVYGYMNDDADSIQLLPHVEALVRFGDIDNRDIGRTEPNSGLINNQRTTVNLEGGLTVNYIGSDNKVRVTLTENNVIYQREFTYNNSTVYVPLGMLQNAAGEYYVPFGLKGVNPAVYSGDAYEYIKLEIAERRLYVERGHAPKVDYNNENHVVVYTPSYHTIGKVPLTYWNKDGGKVEKTFTYTNPASEPKIYKVEPQEISFDESKWLVYSSIDGGVDIEIIGLDFRENVKVNIGSYQATVKEVTTKTIGGVEYDVIVANVPKATVNDVDLELPVMVLNEDSGLATSSNLADIIGPNYSDKTIPIYFVYKKPLSGPRIDTITPQKTSVAGGNEVTIIGSDFRDGAYVIIGTRAGIPILNVPITERGTKIVFTTPTNMTLGSKTVQVLNDDYGIAVKENGIIVVSAPTVSGQVLDLEGNPISRIHVTGGQEILLKGTGFQEGARVYFGGEYLEMKAGDTVPEDEQGLYRDDSTRYVKDGIVAPKVEFIDSETLKVTTPEVTFEGDVTVVVRNPDSGITDGDTVIEYTVPIPTDPLGLKVTVVDNRYIKLYDYVSEAADYFEIYVYIGTKTNAQLMSANFKDFSYLGITDIEPYKIIDLPGLENRSTADRVVFVVKAANKFGPSGYSNLAALTHEDLKDVEELGPPNIDGDIGVPEGEDYTTDQNGGVLQVDFAEKISAPLLTVDMSYDLLKTTTVKRFVLPEKLVQRGMTSITVDLGTSGYRFTPVALNTQTFRTVAQREDAYARITEDTTMSRERSYLVPNIRGKKQVSKVHSISFDASGNRGVQPFNTLSGTLDFTISYADAPLTQAEALQIKLYKYDSAKGTYVPVTATVDRTNKRVTARLKTSGHYVLMTNR